MARTRDEGGFAIIVATIVAMVALILVTAILAMGVHLNTQSVRERRWHLALQLAETGADRAAALLANSSAFAGEGSEAAPITAPGGQYATKVTALGGVKGYQIDAVGWVPSATAGNAVKRRIRVQYTPEPSFQYAIFSSTDLFIKSSGGVFGDVFGNAQVELANGTEVFGSVISATGKIFLNENAAIRKKADGAGGSAYSGGLDTSASPKYGIGLSNNAVIEGDAHVQVPDTDEDCKPPDSADYNIRSSGTIMGKGYLPGAVNGADPAGGTEGACELAHPSDNLPPYTFVPENYPGLQTMTPATFNTQTVLSGNIFVDGSSTDVIDLACKSINGTPGDFALITPVTIKYSNSCASIATYVGPSTRTVQIISTNSRTDPSDPAIDFENKLEIASPAPAFLLYSRGYCDLKNNVVDNGAIYCNGVGIKNNLDISYDGRVESLLGFGTAQYVKSFFREFPTTKQLTDVT